ncbi:hypothetical protein CLV36_101349 [Laceyella sediminis]|uniref:Uncharacterized protein n=1 Tax=Laceyella sediminis TaxID=573074 RepID=A0ABX5ETF0_9BACL|nr:hypothetical protein [Laceyella sediminis]PRZ17247.1 hypothetical protein CLV36_101349 [Laceyella sediminis]
MNRPMVITLMLGSLLAIGANALMNARRRKNKWFRYVYPMLKQVNGNRMMKRMMRNLPLAR